MPYTRAWVKAADDTVTTYLVRSLTGRLNRVPFDVCVLISKRTRRDKRPAYFLIAALQDSDENVRRRAAEALGKLGAPAVEPLIAALQDSDENVRQGAAKALGKLGDTRAVELLIAALKDGDENVRQGAAEALGRLGDARAVEPLTAALGDNDASVRSAAVRALGKLGNPAVELLITALKYSD